VNTQEKQDTHGKQLVSDCCENQTRTDASVLVWRIFFRSCIVACMLLELFQTIPVNTKKQDTHGILLANVTYFSKKYGSQAIAATIGPGLMLGCSSRDFGRL
jgi:hypothetical protein